MYEIIIAILIAILAYIQYSQARSVSALISSQEKFYTAYATYIEAVGAHNDIHECIDKLEDRSEKAYYAITSLASHVEYLEKRVNELEEKCNALQR